MTGTVQGTLKGALFGAISAGAAYGIGNALGHGGGSIFARGFKPVKAFAKALAHGISRGAISMAQGGTFRSGFASGFAASFFSPGTELGGDGAGGFTLRTTIAGLVGGTASEIGGGKFANGAISGAFVHMFNAEGLAYKVSSGISYVVNVVQFLAGAALTTTGWGAILGIPMMAHAANNLYETWFGGEGWLRNIEGRYYNKIDMGVSIASGTSGALRQVGTRAVSYFGNSAIKGYAPVYNYSTTAGKIDLTVTGAGIANSLLVNHE